jgi:ribosomal protein S18 acetylase RimI-like enzyme
MLTIREATDSDATAIGAIARESAEAHVILAPRMYRVPAMADAVRRAQGDLADPSRVTLVAVDEAHVVGFITYRRLPKPDPGSMVRPVEAAGIGIAVTAEHRGRGVGRALMEAAEDRAAREGIELMTLDAFSENRPAIELYQSMGYHASGVLMHRWID